MIPGHAGEVAAARAPGGLHDKVGAVRQLLRKLIAFGIDNGQAVDIFVAVHECHPSAVIGDGRRRVAAKFGRDGLWGTAGQRLPVDAAVSAEEDLPGANRECAAAVANATGDIQAHVGQITGRVASGLRHKHTELAAILPPDERFAGAVPLDVAQIDAAGN